MQKRRPAPAPVEPEDPNRVLRRRRRRSRKESGDNSTYELTPFVRLTRIALILICVLLVIAGGVFVTNEIVIARSESDDVPFNAELWREATRKREQKGEMPRDTRLNMYRDLMGRDLIFGKTKKEIIELLGEPENCPYLDWPWKHFNYWVGQEDGLIRWNNLWIGIYFDKLDRVQQVELLKNDRERFLNL